MAPAVVFLSFADSRLSESMKRLRKQVYALNLFDRCLFCNEFNLGSEFVRKNSWAFSYHSRGFGYFLWKPYLIERSLSELRDGDVLVYSDVGNHFRIENAFRLKSYIDLASESVTPILAPKLSSKYLEQAWTKYELLAFLGVENAIEVRLSPQFEANFILIVNRPRAKEMVRKWNEIYEKEPKLFDDSFSSVQLEGFVEHRHDQSAFSVLGKLHGITEIPGDMDDLVLRLRDKVFRKRPALFVLFLLRKGLLARRFLNPRTKLLQHF